MDSWLSLYSSLLECNNFTPSWMEEKLGVLEMHASIGAERYRIGLDVWQVTCKVWGMSSESGEFAKADSSSLQVKSGEV